MSNLTTINAEVNAYAFAHVVKMLDKVNRKCAKIGAVPFTIQNQTNIDRLVWVDGEEGRVQKVFPRVAFDVVGEIPVISGWKVIASIDHVEGIVKGNVSPEYVKHANCEHCNQNRQRNITCILQNIETGKQIQVGKTCLRDFLGHDPSMMLSFWSFIETITTFCEENSEYGGSGGIATMELNEVLCIAIECVSRYGYVSRKKAEETGYNTTGTEVSGCYFSKRPEDANFRRDAYLTHIEKAKHMIEWVIAKEVDPENSYWYNLKRIAENDYATHKSIGFAVSIVPAYHREMEEKREREAQCNEHFGKVGDKLKEFELEYVKSNGFDTDFGFTYYHFFKDSDGRCFKWRTGNSVDFNEGDKVKVNAGIKSHDEWKGRKQTAITRTRFK